MPEHPGQLRDRVVVIVDPEVDEPVVAAAVAALGADDEQRRRFPAAPIATRGLRGGADMPRAAPGTRVPPASNVSAIPSTTAAPARMLPWAA